MSEECVALPLCWCGRQRQRSIELRNFPVDKGKQSFSQFSVVPLHLSMVFLLIWTDQRLVLPQSILTPESRILQVSRLKNQAVHLNELKFRTFYFSINFKHWITSYSIRSDTMLICGSSNCQLGNTLLSRLGPNTSKPRPKQIHFWFTAFLLNSKANFLNSDRFNWTWYTEKRFALVSSSNAFWQNRKILLLNMHL